MTSRDAGSADALLFECSPRGPKQLQRVARRQLEPAGDGEHAIGRKSIEEGSERFDRVEQRFVERVHASRRRAEGIDQRDLNQVPPFGRARGETACVRHMRADILALPRGIRSPCEHLAHDGEHVRVQLHGIDRACAVVAAPAVLRPRRRHRAPAPAAGHPACGRGARRSRQPDSAGRRWHGVIAVGAPPSVKSPI